ncbi:MAG: TadE/TadG family type IV pilus assembly protein [Anaerolineae bacterium]|nr:TadE/TadG family type IV pilus assembly protein [Anaerolineae bacterium]
MSGQRRDGQAAAELALLLPLLLLIVLGCLDLGRAFSVWLTLANGAREGARFACTLSSMNDADVRRVVERAEADLVSQGLPREGLCVEVIAPGGMVGSTPVQVTASYSLPLTTLYLFGGAPVRISARSEMAVLPGGS